jgi:hypothetical protein
MKKLSLYIFMCLKEYEYVYVKWMDSVYKYVLIF